MPDNKMIPISRQCDLLGLGRSSYYYRSERDDSYNEYLMRLIDEQYTRTPFFGVPKNKSQTEEEKELLEMAAEQFARLFWKQWHLEQESKKIKVRKPQKLRKLYNQGIVER